MHDIRYIRQNPDDFKKAMTRRGLDVDVNEILNMDDEKRNLTTKLDNMRRERNEVSKQIGMKRKAGEKSDDLETAMRELGQEVKAGEERERQLDADTRLWLQKLPNIPADSTPEGLTEKENVVERFWGEMPEYDFEVKSHLDVAERLGILDFQRGGKITGSGFPVWSGAGARLERALINFMLHVQTREHGYREMMTPFLANRESMLGSGQIPKLEDDMYCCERDDLFLIPTSEVALVNMHRGEILKEDQLPIKYVAYSPCFRREGGSYGQMTRGFLRTHQFNKVEMVRFEHPDNSEAVWLEMTGHAEEIIRRLDLHYRVVHLCAGDISFNAAECYDLEVYAPADGGKWLEVSSITNCRDFQARRANIRFKPKGGKAQYPHILNGSGLATSRIMVALLETYQTEEGSVIIPPVLRPFMDGETVITGKDKGK